jgi:nucleoside permease NupC
MIILSILAKKYYENKKKIQILRSKSQKSKRDEKTLKETESYNMGIIIYYVLYFIVFVALIMWLVKSFNHLEQWAKIVGVLCALFFPLALIIVIPLGKIKSVPAKSK